MLTTRIIPCLDVDAGRVVKGVRFQGLRDSGDPVELATRYQAQGADELVLLDVSATPEGRGNALETVRAVRAALGIPLTVGGGVRALADAEALLDAGADKVAINSAAVARPELVDEIAARFGSQATVVAIDAASDAHGGYELVVLSGRERTGKEALAWAREVEQRGAGELLLTSFDRDGTREGYELGLLRATCEIVSVPVIASGGAASSDHFVAAVRAGASALLAASLFHDGDTTVASVKAELAERGTGGEAVIVPSIDLMDGRAVQLVGGKEKVLDAGDPLPIAEKFAMAGPMAVVDLDAALGRGSNREIIERLCERFPCRVGGGIRDEETARRWLDAGAESIVVGTAADADWLARLPRERVTIALDSQDGEVVVDGWRRGTGRATLDRVRELNARASGLLVTFVEREGRLGGTALDRVADLVEAAGDARVTIAGGVTEASEIAALDRAGADAQVGMALYTDRLPLAEGLTAPLTSDREDGLWPTVVTDQRGVALGLCWSNLESVTVALRERRGVYWSRSRGLWRKGETSGATQVLERIELDCDRDALKFVVRQSGPGFCHTGSRTCFGTDNGLPRLERRLAELRESAPADSYTRRLLADPELLRAKLVEEAGELAAAESLRTWLTRPPTSCTSRSSHSREPAFP